MTNPKSTQKWQLNARTRHSATLALFTLLTIIMLYPLSLNLNNMVPEPTDPLLNAWRMQWNAHAALSGPEALRNIFNTNIFYPYPLTLAFSEHFLLLTAQALPLLLLFPSHLVGLNLSVLLSFILSGYGMYLLLTAWTGHRTAGLLAGLLFAFAPHRLGQLNHLELLITPWMPLTLLALHWTLTRPGWRYSVLLLIFLNLQALSGFHYFFTLLIACTLLTLLYAAQGHIRWRWPLGGAALSILLLTSLLNGPIWLSYLRFSELLGAVRTPGEVRIYSAALTDYFTTLPHNWLYGWTFGHWQTADHQFQPLMPLGLTGLVLATISLMAWQRQRTLLSFSLILGLGGMLLSFGLNENALGPTMAPLLSYSPYPWLYDNLLPFQGIRVPGRFSILVLLALSILAGLGAAQLSRLPRPRFALLGLSALFIIMESWSVPLIGPTIPAGEEEIPPVYAWVRDQTAPDAVMLALPHGEASEFLYEYYASHHWRRLANGGSGYTPPIYRDLRRWFNTFPDARAVDISQQMGLDYLILHQNRYTPPEWHRLQDDLPRYLPAISQIKQFADTLLLRLNPSACPPNPAHITATLNPAASMDGLPHALAVEYQNAGPAAFVSDIPRPSQLQFPESNQSRAFLEPLVTPAGETQRVLIPLSQPAPMPLAHLASLNRTISLTTPTSPPPAPLTATTRLPLGLHFADGPQLVSYSVPPTPPTACAMLPLTLNWDNLTAGDTVIAQLLDPFGRLINEQRAPLTAQTSHYFPLPGSLPPGEYGVRVRLLAADGVERQPMTEARVTIPPDQIPPLPLTIHPQPLDLDYKPLPPSMEGRFVNGIELLGYHRPPTELTRHDWLRFTLIWHTEQPLTENWTVFTQLLGPEGQLWAQFDNQPGGNWYATTLWPPAHPLRDDYAYPLDPATPPGDYRLVVGLYDAATGARLPLTTGRDFIEVASVRLLP